MKLFLVSILAFVFACSVAPLAGAQEADGVAIGNALVSGQKVLMLGGLAIVLGMLFRMWRHDEPLLAQLRAAGTALLFALPGALLAFGYLILDGAAPGVAIATAIGVLLMQAGLVGKSPSKPMPAAVPPAKS